ncbi:MAG: hypothetical protein AAB879_02725 [Patescibacteria group bacterium]
MLPLSFLLIAWLVFLGLYGVMSLLSVWQMARFGVIGTGTYLSILLFLSGVAISLLVTWTHLAGVDWSHNVNLFGFLNSASLL